MLESKNKLIPLRRFVVIDGYSKEYLSQLVQRKKLKAQKVGRNYYTTIEWFENYLEQYSRDCKSASISKNLYVSLGYCEPTPKIKQDIPSKTKKLTTEKEVSFLLSKNTGLSIKLAYFRYILAATLVVAVVLFLMSIYAADQVLVENNDGSGELTKGRVAGASEQIIELKNDVLEQGYTTVNKSLYRIQDSVSSSGTNILMLEEVK
jgi:hypothetical protein